jgi:hypothetical protein
LLELGNLSVYTCKNNFTITIVCFSCKIKGKHNEKIKHELGRNDEVKASSGKPIRL